MAAVKTDEKPQAEPTPEQVGYCLNPDCDQDEFKLWHSPVTHPVMCQCGHLMSPHRAGEEADVEPAGD